MPKRVPLTSTCFLVVLESKAQNFLHNSYKAQIFLFNPYKAQNFLHNSQKASILLHNNSLKKNPPQKTRKSNSNYKSQKIYTITAPLQISNKKVNANSNFAQQ